MISISTKLHLKPFGLPWYVFRSCSSDDSTNSLFLFWNTAFGLYSKSHPDCKKDLRYSRYRCRSTRSAGKDAPSLGRQEGPPWVSGPATTTLRKYQRNGLPRQVPPPPPPQIVNLPILTLTTSIIGKTPLDYCTDGSSGSSSPFSSPPPQFS